MPDRDDHTPPHDDSTATAFPPDRTPERIGPYKILEKIGEGGMGVVYLAEQEAPLRRRVALKVIKPGMDSKQVLARFEAERQALALMNHPGVAKVFDAGSTPEGRPYFVMEHVAGIPITEYCGKHFLDNRHRLHLFGQVCDGIQHAHHKGIIHRDIKPSNVLVAVQDGKPVPKVIDFGVAKATQQQLTEQSLFTEQGVLIGTLEYMSPEQAEMNALDIDTRSDVYALGVLLYELLVGALPFDTRELRAAGLEGMLHMIREQEPPKPTVRLVSLGNERSSANARRRHVDAWTLRRQLSGDLDWVTLKALEKDRTRRYGSPAELAADIQRHLFDEPVIAGPPRAAYRLRKSLRRHRLAATLGLVIVLALSVGLLVTTHFFFLNYTNLSVYMRASGAIGEYNMLTRQVSRAIGRAVLTQPDHKRDIGKADGGDIVRGLNAILGECPDIPLVEVLDQAGAVRYFGGRLTEYAEFTPKSLNVLNDEVSDVMSRRRRLQNGLDVREFIVPIYDDYVTASSHGPRQGTLVAEVSDGAVAGLELGDWSDLDANRPRIAGVLIRIEQLLVGVVLSALIGMLWWSRRL